MDLYEVESSKPTASVSTVRLSRCVFCQKSSSAKLIKAKSLETISTYIEKEKLETVSSLTIRTPH